MDFAFFPAVDLRGGKCVQLVGGVPGTEVVALDDPLFQAERWVAESAGPLAAAGHPDADSPFFSPLRGFMYKH